MHPSQAAGLCISAHALFHRATPRALNYPAPSFTAKAFAETSACSLRRADGDSKRHRHRRLHGRGYTVITVLERPQPSPFGHAYQKQPELTAVTTAHGE